MLHYATTNNKEKKCKYRSLCPPPHFSIFSSVLELPIFRDKHGLYELKRYKYIEPESMAMFALKLRFFRNNVTFYSPNLKVYHGTNHQVRNVIKLTFRQLGLNVARDIENEIFMVVMPAVIVGEPIICEIMHCYRAVPLFYAWYDSESDYFHSQFEYGLYDDDKVIHVNRKYYFGVSPVLKSPDADLKNKLNWFEISIVPNDEVPANPVTVYAEPIRFDSLSDLLKLPVMESSSTGDVPLRLSIGLYPYEQCEASESDDVPENVDGRTPSILDDGRSHYSYSTRGTIITVRKEEIHQLTEDTVEALSEESMKIRYDMSELRIKIDKLESEEQLNKEKLESQLEMQKILLSEDVNDKQELAKIEAKIRDVLLSWKRQKEFMDSLASIGKE